MSAPEQTTPQSLLADFVGALEGLQTSVQRTNIDGRSLQQQFLTVQQLYQQQLLPTLAVSPLATSLTPYQTEMNRAFRLLGMDVTFLQTAKNVMTMQKRQAQMRQRLKTVLEFSRGLQEQLRGHEPLTAQGEQSDASELE
ncbi:MAG: heterocyst frequency control protein PatD [Leptolyngbya sp. SIO1D8]|nr:heterocyst frequency control protein PatD [Leptolyngbya sp. SIO1D8]